MLPAGGPCAATLPAKCAGFPTFHSRSRFQETVDAPGTGSFGIVVPWFCGKANCRRAKSRHGYDPDLHQSQLQKAARQQRRQRGNEVSRCQRHSAGLLQRLVTRNQGQATWPEFNEPVSGPAGLSAQVSSQVGRLARPIRKAVWENYEVVAWLKEWLAGVLNAAWNDFRLWAMVPPS